MLDPGRAFLQVDKVENADKTHDNIVNKLR